MLEGCVRKPKCLKEDTWECQAELEGTAIDRLLLPCLCDCHDEDDLADSNLCAGPTEEPL
jgi:hypothetical protein